MRFEDSDWNVLVVGDILILSKFVSIFDDKFPVMALVTKIKIEKWVNPQTLEYDGDLVISSDCHSSIELNFKFWFDYYGAHEVPKNPKSTGTFFSLDLNKEFKNNWTRLAYDNRIHKIGSDSEDKELLTKDYWNNNERYRMLV